MGRGVLMACLPWLGALIASILVARLVVRLDGARWEWRRIRLLHSDQGGSAQTLSFVLTLPLFIMVMLFIVQVSQLMIGTVIVHYAAFAAARSAVVWIPARVTDGESENCISTFQPDREAGGQRPPIVNPTDPNYGPTEGGVTYLIAPGSPKYEKIASAAVLACMPICPSRDLGLSPSGGGLQAADVLRSMYLRVAPGSLAGEGAINRRLDNKLAYAIRNTAVEIRFFHPNSEPPLVTYGEPPDLEEFRPGREMGWQDPVTVTVTHYLGLLPGPGRLLARQVHSPDGSPDALAQHIGVREGIYVFPLTASATLGNEGDKSVLPYVYQTN